MDYDKLIEDMREIAGKNSISLYKRGRCADAATAIETLRAENEKLLAELEQVREYAREATVTMNNLYGACGQFCDDTIWSFRQRWRDI